MPITSNHSYSYNNLPHKFKQFSCNCIDLLNGLLTWDPKKRMTVDEALLHEFFYEEPFPVQPSEIKALKFLQQIDKEVNKVK